MTTVNHTDRCKALRKRVDALHDETVRAFRRSEQAGNRTLDREAPMRAQLIACHVGANAECYVPAEQTTERVA